MRLRIVEPPLHAIQEIVGKDPAQWRFFTLLPLSHLDLATGASADLMIRDHVKRFVAMRLRLGGVATPRGSLPIEGDVNQDDLAVTGHCLTPLRRAENFHRDQLTLNGPKFGWTAAEGSEARRGRARPIKPPRAGDRIAINDSII